jgi:hypothetical protein
MFKESAFCAQMLAYTPFTDTDNTLFFFFHWTALQNVFSYTVTLAGRSTIYAQCSWSWWHAGCWLPSFFWCPWLPVFFLATLTPSFFWRPRPWLPDFPGTPNSMLFWRPWVYALSGVPDSLIFLAALTPYFLWRPWLPAFENKQISEKYKPRLCWRYLASLLTTEEGTIPSINWRGDHSGRSEFHVRSGSLGFLVPAFRSILLSGS